MNQVLRCAKRLLDVPLDDLSLDEPIPVDRLLTPEQAVDSPNLHASRYPNLYRIAVEERPTLRAMIPTRAKITGHQFQPGTPATIADDMQHWYESDACDGFTIIPPYMPEGFGRMDCTAVKEQDMVARIGHGPLSGGMTAGEFKLAF